MTVALRLCDVVTRPELEIKCTVTYRSVQSKGKTKYVGGRTQAKKML